MAYKIYLATDSGGNSIPIFAPEFEGTESTYNDGKWSMNLGELITNDPTFVIEATLFCSNEQTAQTMRAFGFPNVYSFESLNGDIWTLDNNHIIKFTSSGYEMRLNGSYWGAESTTTGSNYATFISLYSVNRYSGHLGTGFCGINMYFYPIRSVSEPAPAVLSYGCPQARGMYRTNSSGFWDDLTPYTPPSDPYSGAGDSGTGGGGGSWDDGSDPVPIPSLPSVGATNTGFISLFVPTQAQLQQVANYLWSSLFDVSTFFKIFENPMDCILGLSVVPVAVPTSGSAQITIGNIELSGIYLPLASQQYVEVDCGSLTITPYFGSYLDYEPYTKMSLFVPYSGVHSVNADDLMGKTVHLVYHIDILTGSLVAFVKSGDSVLYEFNGACGSNIPVNSVNYASTIENAIRIAVNIGTTVATAGASAPLSMGAEGVSTAQNVARGISLAGSTAEGALSMKPNIDRAGSLGGTTGILGNQTPYFIITRPRLCKPKNQNKIKGYPAFINYAVSELVDKGYTEFDTIILNGLYLTEEEKNELNGILLGGVYL